MGILFARLELPSEKRLYGLALAYCVLDGPLTLGCKVRPPMAKTSCLHVGISCMRLKLAIPAITQAV